MSNMTDHRFDCLCLHSVNNKHLISCWQIQQSKILMSMCISCTHIKWSLHEHACLPQLPLHWHTFRMLTKVIEPGWNPQLCWDSCVARCAWPHFTCPRITTLHADILWMPTKHPLGHPLNTLQESFVLHI